MLLRRLVKGKKFPKNVCLKKFCLNSKIFFSFGRCFVTLRKISQNEFYSFDIIFSQLQSYHSHIPSYLVTIFNKQTEKIISRFTDTRILLMSFSHFYINKTNIPLFHTAQSIPFISVTHLIFYTK